MRNIPGLIHGHGLANIGLNSHLILSSWWDNPQLIKKGSILVICSLIEDKRSRLDNAQMHVSLFLLWLSSSAKISRTFWNDLSIM